MGVSRVSYAWLVGNQFEVEPEEVEDGQGEEEGREGADQDQDRREDRVDQPAAPPRSDDPEEDPEAVGDHERDDPEQERPDEGWSR